MTNQSTTMEPGISLDARLIAMLEQRKLRSTYRSLKEYKTVQSASLRKGRKQGELVDFSSNDYLSLTHSAKLRSAYLKRIESCQDPLFGSTGSRLLDGTTPHHTNLENRLAEFFRYSDSQEHTSALLFNSGYDANVSFFSTIPQRGDYIVYDELVHASVWDGMRANSRRGVPEASRFSFAHNSVQALEKRLNNIVQQESKKSGSGVIYIAIESLYSMDGDLCPLSELVEVLQRLSRRHPLIINPKRVCLILDEAHTTGVLGADGRGLAWDLDHRGTRTGNGILRDWVQVRIMTFGKAVGSQGAVLIASPAVRQFLINYARPFIFSTAMSVNNVLAIESAFEILRSEEGDERRQALNNLCQLFRRQVSQWLDDAKIPPSLISLLANDSTTTNISQPTWITPLITPHPHSLADFLRSQGYLTRPVVHPTVPKGKERVRICLHADNRPEDVIGLIKAIGTWSKTKSTDHGAARLRAKL